MNLDIRVLRHKENERTANKRFGVMQGIRPQKVLSGFQADTPARTFVLPHPNAKPQTVMHKQTKTELADYKSLWI